MTKTAGLSRAYAVLRQLEVLRQQDVLDPLPPDTDTGSSNDFTETSLASPPPPSTERTIRSDALQRVLHDIVERRRYGNIPSSPSPAREASRDKSSPHASDGRESNRAAASVTVSDYAHLLPRGHSRRRDRSKKKVRGGDRLHGAKPQAMSPVAQMPSTADFGADMPRALVAHFNAAECVAFPEEPLLPYVCELVSSGSADMRQALQAMDGRVDCRDWFALTALLNTATAICHIVVPLFLAELVATEASDAADSRASHIVCALAGLGGLASGALRALVDMLRRGAGHARLVALAIRAVGGDDGVAALCRIAANHSDSVSARAAAVYGIGLLAHSVPGHTTVCALGGLAGRVVFHQPRAALPSDEEALQRVPPYRATIVLLDAHAALRGLTELVESRAFRRADSGAHERLPHILCDFARAAPDACRHMGTHVPETFAALAQEAENALRGVRTPPRVLPFAYNTHFVGRADKLFAIEEALLTTLLDQSTPEPVVEQTLVTIASLPDFATTHAAEPILDFVVQCVARLEQSKAAAANSDCVKSFETIAESDEAAESVVIAGLVALGRLARGDATPPAVTDTACELMLHALTSHRSRVRHGACIGLGELGAVSNRRDAIVRALAACFGNDTVHGETVAWALARVGRHGVRVLLDTVEGRGGRNCSPALRITAARALARCDVFAACVGIADDAAALRARVVRRLSEAITREGLAEDVAVECAYALGEFVAGPPAALGPRGFGEATAEESERTDEAAVYYRDVAPNEAYEVLSAVLDAAVLPFSVQRALFFLLCAHGGPHGEFYASNTVIQSTESVSRAAAAFGLRACGGKIIRTLVMALNDESVEVRHEAFDALDAVGAEAVLSILRTRPRRHTQQVTAALRDCLLRDMNRKTKRQAAQDIYTTLSQLSLN